MNHPKSHVQAVRWTFFLVCFAATNPPSGPTLVAKNPPRGRTPGGGGSGHGHGPKKRVKIEGLCVAMCCSVLQCVAVCCSVLQCVAVCCSVLRIGLYVVVCCSVLQCVAVCCSVLQCIAVRCIQACKFLIRDTHSPVQAGPYVRLIPKIWCSFPEYSALWYIHTSPFTNIYTHPHPQTHPHHTHADTHIHIHTHIHTHTYNHTHTSTHNFLPKVFSVFVELFFDFLHNGSKKGKEEKNVCGPHQIT